MPACAGTTGFASGATSGKPYPQLRSAPTGAGSGSLAGWVHGDSTMLKPCNLPLTFLSSTFIP